MSQPRTTKENLKVLLATGFLVGVLSSIFGWLTFLKLVGLIAFLLVCAICVCIIVGWLTKDPFPWP